MNKGLFAGIGAYILWGVFPLYWKALDTVPAIQILAHRMTWALLFLAAVLTNQKDWHWVPPTMQNRRSLGIYTLAAILLSVNWFTYIWGVNAGFIVETSLGYFINPLVNVLLGVIFLGERLRRGQFLAVSLAAIGVLYLTFVYGGLPWIALVLAFTFAIYGLLKKIAPLSATRGLTLETAAMFLPAAAYLIYLDRVGSGAFGHQAFLTTALLALAGPVTAIPLLLFGVAARRIPLSMVGFLQYIAPTLQFLIGVLIFQEPFPLQRLIGFCIIWVALVIFMLDAVQNSSPKSSPV
jgi:chloramphenicol-sensitive protein RarD